MSLTPYLARRRWWRWIDWFSARVHVDLLQSSFTFTFTFTFTLTLIWGWMEVKI